MEATPKLRIASIITDELIGTLIDLMKTLQEMPEDPPNEVQAGVREIGYSASIVVLAVTILESAITRYRYVMKELEGRPNATDYFIAKCADKLLCDQIEEIVVLRDCIVHSHISEEEIYWDDQLTIKRSSKPERLTSFGNSRLKKVENKANMTTTILQLNLFPRRIWRRDALLTIKILGKALDYMTKAEPNRLGIDLLPRMGWGWPTNLREIAKSLVIPVYI